MSVNPVNSSIAAFAQRNLRFGFRIGAAGR